MKDIYSCEECGSVDVQVMDSAWFDPNNDLEFIEACEMTPTMKWCNNCDSETSLVTKENNSG